uniref:SHSP domain-containing protein n=1 Tax=Strigamia maritima TaxID=126957 RepID=T1IWE3_STRMM
MAPKGKKIAPEEHLARVQHTNNKWILTLDCNDENLRSVKFSVRDDVLIELSGHYRPFHKWKVFCVQYVIPKDYVFVSSTREDGILRIVAQAADLIEAKKKNMATFNQKPLKRGRNRQVQLGTIRCSPSTWTLSIDMTNDKVRQIKFSVDGNQIEISGLYRPYRTWKSFNERYVLPEGYQYVSTTKKDGLMTITGEKAFKDVEN